MTVSEYIKALQALKRKHGDVPVVMRRYSDLRREVEPPEMTRMLPEGGNDWATREHSRMSEEQKARLVTVIELVGGN